MMIEQIDISHITSIPSVPAQQPDAFKIHPTNITFTIPKELVPECTEDAENKNQTLISKLISRFHRYRKPPTKIFLKIQTQLIQSKLEASKHFNKLQAPSIEQKLEGVKTFNNPQGSQFQSKNEAQIKIQHSFQSPQNQTKHKEDLQRIDLKFKKIDENHFYVKTSHNLFVYKVDIKGELKVDVPLVIHVPSKDYIMAVDILIRNKLSILMISTNSNGEYYLKIIDGPKIDFNQKINGANFLNQNQFLVYLEQQILLYNLEQKANRVTLINRTNKTNRYNYSESFTVVRLESINVVKDSQVFIIYVCKVTNNKQPEKKNMVRYNLMLEQFNIVDNQIKNYENRLLEDYFQEIKLQDLIIFNYSQKIGLLLVLNNSILFIKEKQDREGHLFFTVQATSVQQNCFLLLREDQEEVSSAQQFLLIKQIRHQKEDKENYNIMLMNLNILSENKKFQVQDSLQKSIKDIIIMKEMKRFEVCSTFNGQLLFFFADKKTDTIKFKIYLTEKVLPSEKINEILNEEYSDKKYQDITKESLDLLLQLNETYQKQIHPQGNRYNIRNNLYKIIWNKIKQLESEHKRTKQQFDSERKMRQISYLYKTRDLKFIKSQWKRIIHDQNEIKVDQLKEHYSKLKLLALQQLTKNFPGLNKVQTFEIYLKSTFYLKKLQVIQEVKLNELDYKRWKKRDITEIFFTQWKARRFNYVRKFLRRFKSYFIERYERILQKIFQGQNLKNKKLDLLSEDKLDLLKIILPSHRKSKDNEGGYTIGFDIDFVSEETCYQDLELNSELLEQLIKERNLITKLTKKYMKNNDFLFLNRQSLREKQNALIQNRESIHIFLALYIEKCKYTNFEQYKSCLDLLRKGQFINLEFYFKLKCQLLMYDEFREDINPDENLQKFLKLTPTQVFRKIINQGSDNLKQRIHFLLTKIKNIWEFISNEKNMMVEEQTNSLNEFDIENAEIFQTVIKKSFEITEKDIMEQEFSDSQEDKIQQEISNNRILKFQKKLVDRYKMFFLVIHELQDDYQRNNPLLIQCLIYSVFRTIPVNTFREDLKEIYEVLQQINLREDYPLDLRHTLNLVCQNQQFFRVFQIDKTIFEIENRNEYELDYQPNFELLSQVIQVYLNNRDRIPKKIKFQGEDNKINTINELLQLLYKFCESFYRRLDEQWVILLVQKIFGAALGFRLANPDSQFAENIMYELQQVIADKQTVEDLQKPIEILKKVIEEAKSEQNWTFIKDCLGILEGSQDQQSFVDQQALMIRLQTKQFTADTLGTVKSDYLKVLQNLQNLDLPMLMQLYVKAVSDFIDNQIDSLAKQEQHITLETILNLVQNFSNSRCDKPQLQTFEILYLVIKLLMRQQEKINKQNQYREKSKREKSIDSTESILSLFISLERKDIEGIQRTFKNNWLKIVSEVEIEERNTGIVLNVPVQSQYHSNSFQSNNKSKTKEKITRKVQIQIYTYVREYLNEIKYFTFGQLLFYDYERAVMYFLRYRKRLDLSLDKIVLIMKGFLRSNPKNLREEKMSPRLASKSQKISYKLQLTIQMLYSYLNDGYYILMKEKVSTIESYVKQRREDLSSYSDTNKNLEALNVISKILQFIALYKQNSEQIQPEDRDKKVTEHNISKNNKIQKTQRNNEKIPQNINHIDSKNEKKSDLPLEELFKKSSAREFIKAIQTRNQLYDESVSNNLNNSQQSPTIHLNVQNSNNNLNNLNNSNIHHLNTSNFNLNTSNNNLNSSSPPHSQRFLEQPIQIIQKKIFSMYYFRIYVRCIKFNEWMHNLFPFEFFLETDSTKQVKKSSEDKEYGVRKILESHLKEPIFREINQDNFIQIAKSMRYGFNNSEMMEFEIILLYLKKCIENYKEERKNENGMQLEQLLKRLKNVLDSFDSEYLLEPKVNRILELLEDLDIKERIIKLIEENR